MASTRDGLTFCDHGPITFVAQEAQDAPVTKETHDAGQAFRLAFWMVFKRGGCARSYRSYQAAYPGEGRSLRSSSLVGATHD